MHGAHDEQRVPTQTCEWGGEGEEAGSPERHPRARGDARGRSARERRASGAEPTRTSPRTAGYASVVVIWLRVSDGLSPPHEKLAKAMRSSHSPSKSETTSRERENERARVRETGGVEVGDLRLART